MWNPTPSTMEYGFIKRVIMRTSAHLLRSAAGLAMVIGSWLGSAHLTVASERGMVQPAAINANIPPFEAHRSASETVETATRQVYRVLVEIEGAIKGGTAFLVSGKRIIATNQHVIDQGTAYSVGFIDDNGVVKRIPLRLIAIFPQKDLALLEALDDLPGDPLPLAAGYPTVASDLFAIGFPAAADPQGVLSWAQGEDSTFFIPSVLKGYVSRVLTNRWFSSQLQHQTPIIPGYSGGPLIDDDGVVFAISTAIHKEANGISYGVLSTDLVDFLTACSLPAHVAQVGRPISSPYMAHVRQIAPPEKSEVIEPTASSDPSDLDMLARGNDYLDRGDIVAARLMFRYLVDRRNLPDAYSGLAKTYDPIFLDGKKVVGVMGDADTARALYEKAARLGGSVMRQLASNGTPRAGGCNDSVCSLINSVNGPIVACERTNTAQSRSSQLRR